MDSIVDTRKIKILLSKIEKECNFKELEKFEDITVTAILIWCGQVIEISESSNSKKSYRVIKFFRDWCAHAFLSKNFSFNKRVIQDLEEKIQKDNNLRVSKGRAEFTDSEKKSIYISHIMSDYLELKKLKEDLKEFFQEYGINTNFLEIQEEWFSFRRILLELLISTPLYFNLNEKGKALFVVNIESPEIWGTKEANSETFVCEAQFCF